MIALKVAAWLSVGVSFLWAAVIAEPNGWVLGFAGGLLCIAFDTVSDAIKEVRNDT